MSLKRSNEQRLANMIKAEAKRLGFYRCGIAQASAVDENTAQRYKEWIARGHHAAMAYMERHGDLRLDPRLLLPGAQSVVCVAMCYAPPTRLPQWGYDMAAYALGRDYHDLMRERLKQLAEFIKAHFQLPPVGEEPKGGQEAQTYELTSAQASAQTSAQASTQTSAQSSSIIHCASIIGNSKGNSHMKLAPSAPGSSPTGGGWEGACSWNEARICCDTAPMLERYWAAQAGIGFIGRNCQLIIPGAGSMFFLGEILTDVALAPDSPMKPRCGHCHACIDACPTGALQANGGLDARRCLSYLTIESREPLPPEAAKAMGNGIYGCDLCQAACPHNRHAPTTTEAELMPSPQLMAMTKDNWHSLSIEQYRQLFKGSAVKRAKYEGLMRNIMAAKANQEDSN